MPAAVKQRTIRCRRCGQMFEYEGLPPPCCPVCQLEREEQYQIVRALVRDFPGITALEVHEITEVPMDVILRYINKGLIEVIEHKNYDGIVSERVGLMIQKAKEKKLFFERQKEDKKRKPEALDTLKIDEHDIEKEKFTWLRE